MANIIIKSDGRQKRENKILRDFGYTPGSAGRVIKEYAECVAEKSREAIKQMEGRKR